MKTANKIFPEQKLEILECIAFENCLRLHTDSIFLFKNGSYPSAFFLSVLALEEFGKVLWVDDCIYNTKINRYDRAGQLKWLNNILFRTYKQGIFANTMRFDLPKPTIKLIENNEIKVDKQSSMYVGFPKKGKK